MFLNALISENLKPTRLSYKECDSLDSTVVAEVHDVDLVMRVRGNAKSFSIYQRFTH